jgi:hypothetical protein
MCEVRGKRSAKPGKFYASHRTCTGGVFLLAGGAAPGLIWATVAQMGTSALSEGIVLRQAVAGADLRQSMVVCASLRHFGPATGMVLQ